MKTLLGLYVVQLQVLYSFELYMIDALDRFAERAASPTLRRAFAGHQAQTAHHVERLEQILFELETTPRGHGCRSVGALLEESDEMLEQAETPNLRDAVLSSSAQHIEQYEVIGYRIALIYALTLGKADHATLLRQTLDEEAKADASFKEQAEQAVTRSLREERTMRAQLVTGSKQTSHSRHQ